MIKECKQIKGQGECKHGAQLKHSKRSFLQGHFIKQQNVCYYRLYKCLFIRSLRYIRHSFILPCAVLAVSLCLPSSVFRGCLHSASVARGACEVIHSRILLSHGPLGIHTTPLPLRGCLYPVYRLTEGDFPLSFQVSRLLLCSHSHPVFFGLISFTPALFLHSSSFFQIL